MAQVWSVTDGDDRPRRWSPENNGAPTLRDAGQLVRAEPIHIIIKDAVFKNFDEKLRRYRMAGEEFTVGGHACEATEIVERWSVEVAGLNWDRELLRSVALRRGLSQ